jgi:hypothetical protein
MTSASGGPQQGSGVVIVGALTNVEPICFGCNKIEIFAAGNEVGQDFYETLSGTAW